ncbi:hypothetical protein [Novosphingobium pokkalii]|uniref:Uncharacterized protein n=1 Tax=Novosphingobium pokkalii TaxID=1770194 RepID=A0ABV7V173_9SPHN|nr:hypothetical protein [Novosphingobium pokkalii]
MANDASPRRQMKLGAFLFNFWREDLGLARPDAGFPAATPAEPKELVA